MSELPTKQIIHCECCCVDREFREVIGLAPKIDAKAQLLNAPAYGFYEPLDDWTLHAAPIGNFIDNGLAVLMKHLYSRPYTVSSFGREIGRAHV